MKPRSQGTPGTYTPPLRPASTASPGNIQPESMGPHMRVLGRELGPPFDAYWAHFRSEIPVPVEHIEEGLISDNYFCR